MYVYTKGHEYMKYEISSQQSSRIMSHALLPIFRDIIDNYLTQAFHMRSWDTVKKLLQKCFHLQLQLPENEQRGGNDY